MAHTGIHHHLAVLRTDVLSAFGTIQRPPEFRIAPHACEKCAQLSADLAAIEWTAMPDALVEEHPTGLSLLSPEAYAYFLPAYVLYALAHFTRNDFASEMTVYSLAFNEPVNEDMADWHRERLKFITAEQLSVLERFLQRVEADSETWDCFDSEEMTEARARLRQFWTERWTV